MLVLMLAIGCASVSSRDAVSHREVFADPILDGWRPNYAYPFVEPPDLKRARIELESGCRGGDPRACWKARLERETAANCRRGHHMSCRALIVGGPFPDRLPGAKGRQLEGCSLDALERCDLVALWEECIADFTRSCRDVRDVLNELGIPFLHVALRDRMTGLARSGCAEGIAWDCLFLAALGTDAEARFADEMLCRLDDSSCHSLARRVFLEGDHVRAHGLLEYACQRGIMADCESLGVLYRTKVFPEPIAGRGERLLDMACRFRVERADSFQHAVDTYLRQCMTRSGMWDSYDRAFFAPIARIEPP